MLAGFASTSDYVQSIIWNVFAIFLSVMQVGSVKLSRNRSLPSVKLSGDRHKFSQK